MNVQKQPSPAASTPSGEGHSNLERNRMVSEADRPRLDPWLRPSLAQERRWRSETAFFDRLAEVQLARVTPFAQELLQRYEPARLRPHFNKEYRFLLLGDLAGRRVLDVGCGDGSNAVLLAKRGAHVVGVDLSPRSIALCRRRAEVNGVAERCDFVEGPLEALDLPQGSFDVVWGDGILHHILPELDVVLPRLVRAAADNARFVFSEPVSFHPALRWLRRHVPIHTDATPDERPLTPAELERVRHHLPGLRVRPFGALGRINRFLTVNGSYEQTRGARRSLLDWVQQLDWRLLSLGPLATLGSMCVLTATRPRLPG